MIKQGLIVARGFGAKEPSKLADGAAAARISGRVRRATAWAAF